MDERAPQSVLWAPSDPFAGDGDMRAFMRAYDWTATPLGPPATWPRSLHTILHVLLNSRHPMFLWWGPELIQFYNDGYRPSLGDRHPGALGARGPEFWTDIWAAIGPQVEAVMQRGEATWHEDDLVPIIRNGRLEEVYWTYSYSPVLDDDGHIGGTLVTCQETTPHVLSQRRLALLRALAEHATAEGRTVADTCRIAATVLAEYDADVAFALLYLDDGERLQLVQQVGDLPALARPATVAKVAADAPGGEPDEPGSRPGMMEGAPNAGEAHAWPLAAAVAAGHAIVVDDLPARFGHLPGGRWPEPAEQALVLPITGAGQERPYGVLVAGLSPRLPLDEHYRGFLDLVAGQIASALANAQAYQAERQRAEALAELDRAKTAFFSNVSHEFRTPLTLLLGPLEEAIADEHAPLAATQRQRLELAQRNGLRLLRLVNALLDFSRLEAGRADAAYEATELATYTAELASVFQSAVEAAGLRLLVDCPPLPPETEAYVDRDMWEKIVLNLLSNALKFTFDGEIAVSLHPTGDGRRLELRVRDTGVGIPPDEVPRIFERFHRIRDQRARTYEGTGIGLSLVQELVRLHGGEIAASSTPGQGTELQVSIPAGSAHLSADRILAREERTAMGPGARPFVEEALRWSAPGPPERAATASGQDGEQAPREDRPRILVADDNADMREYITHLLGERYVVETAADGEHAFARVLEALPDLVLADVMMPGRNGFALLAALRADPHTRDLPVLLLSARAGEEARVEGMAAGADDYLVKPFAARELLARVDGHLALHRQRTELLARAQAAHARAEAALQAREQFFASVTHDLKNPLSAVHGYAELLQRRLARSQQAAPDWLDPGLTQIMAGVRRTVAFIDELLDVARLQSDGQLELQREPTDLVALCRGIIADYQRMTQRHQLELVAPAQGVVGQWDRARLDRVITNLVENAVKYSPDGGDVQVRLDVVKEADGGEWAILAVQDHGVGIPADDLPYIFEQFHRAGNVAEQIRGSGVGLASARLIIAQHGGSITVASEEGAGSTFAVRLPLDLLGAEGTGG